MGRLTRIFRALWCRARGHREREIGWPGLFASRVFACPCGLRYREYERPKAVTT